MQDRVYRVNSRILLPTAGAVFVVLVGGYFQFVTDLDMSATTALAICLGLAVAAGLTWLGLHRRLTTVVSANAAPITTVAASRRICLLLE